MRSLTILLPALVLLLLPGRALAQDDRAVITTQLDTVVRVFSQRGFQATPAPLAGTRVMGVLSAGASSMLEVNLAAGRQYLVAAACDKDCSDLDLRLFTASGTKVAEDVEDDDTPILSFTAPASGRYLLGVILSKCSTAVCHYGFSIFQK